MYCTQPLFCIIFLSKQTFIPVVPTTFLLVDFLSFQCSPFTDNSPGLLQPTTNTSALLLFIRT